MVNVENMCKTLFILKCKFCELVCIIFTKSIHYVENSPLFHIYPNFYTSFFTTSPPLYFTNFIHFSTSTITITTNKLI